MAFKVFKFYKQGSDHPGSVDQLNIADMKAMQAQLKISEILCFHGKGSITVFMFSESILPRDEEVLDVIKTFNKGGLYSKENLQALDEQNAIKHFYKIAGGMSGGPGQPDFIKSFTSDFNNAKKESLIGAVFQRLFQRSIWFHEKVRLNSNYFSIALTVPGIFCDLSRKIFESLNSLVVQIDGLLAETYLIIDGLYQSGCRRFLFCGNKDEYTFLKNQTNPAINILSDINELSIDTDILIINNPNSSLLTLSAVSNRMAQKNNAPLLVLSNSEDLNKQKILRKFYSAYFYNYSDLERAIDKNKKEQAKIFKDINPWLEEEVDAFYTWLLSDSRYRFVNIIGRSPQMQNLFEVISRISQTDITVLIQGGSGTGKELVSHAVHKLSSRSEKPFVVVNCGAIPENLLESELFGHVRGSFTGAIANKNGLFFEADRGTIFLDEIAELPQQLQVKLLRFLQEGDIKPVGSNNTLKVDVRVIAATNKNLYEMVNQGTFRNDLFYRLNVMMLELPALKERKEDIIILAEHFLNKYSKKFKKEVCEFSKKTVQYFQNYDWPGNIRELENAVEHAVALSSGNQVIEFDLPQSIRESSLDISNNKHFGDSTLKNVEKNYILYTLNSTKWDYDKACTILGIGRTTLWRKLKEYNVKSLP